MRSLRSSHPFLVPRLLCLVGIAAAVLLCRCPARAQSNGAGTVAGTLSDPSGAAVPGASVKLANSLRGFERTTTTDAQGHFQFANVPFDAYQIRASAPGFNPAVRSLQITSAVPLRVAFKLDLKGSTQTVSVEAASAVAQTLSPSAQTNLDQSQMNMLPQPSPASGLSDLITYSSPSVAADSNGFFHPLGDHAQQTFVVDGQPNSDQQSKLFSTSIPANAVASMDIITAAPSAEFGDKTSMVVEATTKSGLGATAPHGALETYYGSFGTIGENANLSFGNNRFGSFTAVDAVRSGRFMDAPEFQPLHDAGNNTTIFQRLDFQPDASDTFHLDFTGARNWFQIPNTFDQAAFGQDQRQQVLSFNIAPSYQHIFGPSSLITFNPWIRRDQVGYFPSADGFDDRPATLSQNRDLTNWGGKLDYAYTGHGQNLTLGSQVMQTRLREAFRLGLTDPLFNAVCVNGAGQPVVAPGVNSPSACASGGDSPNPAFNPGLLPFDLSRGGSLFKFQDSKNIDEYAVYAQDSVQLGNLNLSPGLRVNRYDGLVHYTGVQPRLGGSYRLRRTGTIARLSYSRSYESPYNENLLVSSATGQGGLATNVFGAFAGVPLQPGKRNDFDTGIQQALGSKFQFDGDYFWKFTDSAFDFDTLFNTPITFPITWRKSKIDGFGLRISSVAVHGFTFNTTMGHSRARFFGPETGGVIFNSPLNENVFRIDHDQSFQQSTNVSYRHGSIWTDVTWRFDSGLVAGAVPTLASVLALDGDQQAQIGFFCGSQFATRTQPITSCALPFGQWGATRVRIPAPGTENDDTHPARISPRSLLDLSLGDDRLRRTEHGTLTARLSLTNLANTEALYNFLSTFSGTHFVSPRTVQLTLGWSF